LSPPVVEVAGLTRTFRVGRRTVTALRDVSLTVSEGTVVGLLGANGAGKTTLTKIIGTMLLPTAGSVRVFGHDVVRSPTAARAVTGTVFGGDRGLYGRLTGRENAEFFAMVRGVGSRTVARRVQEVLTETGLQAAADRPVETYSKGMRQRLHIAIGTVSRPRLLLLDEPTVGLDPLEAERLRTSVARLRDIGVTVVLTSHYLLDIEQLADRVVILAAGAVSADMPLAEFIGLAGYIAVVTVRGREPLPPALASPDGRLAVISVDRDGPLWTARLGLRDWGAGSLADLSRLLGEAAVVDVRVAPVRLEDVYTRLSAPIEQGVDR
jgi:ABC-2 type transport system ATP-binding protein